jgi:hypothetical protein
MEGTIPHVTLGDLGSYWLGPDGKVWEICTYCEGPTVSFRRVDDHAQRRGGAVGSEITRGFRRLVLEELGK